MTVTLAWRASHRSARVLANGLSRVIEYRLMSGKEGASPLRQLVAHLVNHATHHRGQVTTLLRQLGAAPAKSTDMIAFFRERAEPLASAAVGTSSFG